MLLNGDLIIEKFDNLNYSNDIKNTYIGLKVAFLVNKYI